MEDPKNAGMKMDDPKNLACENTRAFPIFASFLPFFGGGLFAYA